MAASTASRCGHPTPDGRCRNRVTASARCAAGHPATRRATAAVAPSAAGHPDPFAAPSAPPPEVTETLETFTVREDAQHVLAWPTGNCGTIATRFSRAAADAGLHATVAHYERLYVPDGGAPAHRAGNHFTSVVTDHAGRTWTIDFSAHQFDPDIDEFTASTRTAPRVVAGPPETTLPPAPHARCRWQHVATISVSAAEDGTYLSDGPGSIAVADVADGLLPSPARPPAEVPL